MHNMLTNEHLKQPMPYNYNKSLYIDAEENLYMKVIDESDLSFKRLDELHGQLLALEKEKSDHLKQELDHLNTLNSLCAVLEGGRVTSTGDDIRGSIRRGSSCVYPLCSFAPSGSSSRFPSLAENNVPNVIPTVVNLSEPIFGGFLRLLMSKEGVQNILSTSTNLVENGAPLTEVDLPSFPNRSYDQATLDAVYQDASNSFLSQSSLDNFVADFAETTGLDWTASGNIHHDFFDSSSSDLSTILNFDADDLQILQPFLND
ncbi:hypothetical protein LguiB_033986 [Lonicera macranthoides]